MPSSSNTAMLASATAEAIGCPANVKPWANDAPSARNGSISRSEAMSAPIGA
jgi:hypothetical protein